MSNATLVINSNKGFTNDIWQYENEFTRKQWKSIINGFVDLLNMIYDMLGDDDIAETIFTQYDFTDGELYALCDIINMLNNIDVVIKHRKENKDDDITGIL